MEQIPQSLAGRISIFTLLPLSLAELGGLKSEDTSLSNVLFHGFFPKLYAEKMDPGRYYQNYIRAYLERDVRLLKHRRFVPFQRFPVVVRGQDRTDR